jgi:acyl-CoA hydrolase
MYGGRLLFRLDELTFIEAFQLFPSFYVTAGVNRIVFRRPIYVSTGVTYVGSTSVEVGFVVEAFGLRGRRRVTDSYFTFVNMAGGKPGEIKAAPRGDAAAIRRKEESISETRQLKMLTFLGFFNYLQILDNDVKEPSGVVFQGGDVVEP